MARGNFVNGMAEDEGCIDETGGAGLSITAFDQGYGVGYDGWIRCGVCTCNSIEAVAVAIDVEF